MTSRMLVAALAATTLLAGGAAYADQHGTNQSTTTPPGHAAVVKDFGKLSVDGARAYQDLTLARLAIFDGRTADAKKYVDDADSGFNKAKGDESVFNQAEATMRSRSMQKSGSTTSNDKSDAGSSAGSSSNAQSASRDASANGSDVNKPIAWLPVDGGISINEDFTAKPEKAKAVQDANKSLAQGDKKGALDKLKLADVNTEISIAVVPLQQTIDDVNQAKQLIDSGKFYEGSQKLRAVQEATMITIADVNSVPAKGQGGAPAKATDATH